MATQTADTVQQKIPQNHYSLCWHQQKQGTPHSSLPGLKQPLQFGQLRVMLAPQLAVLLCCFTCRGNMVQRSEPGLSPVCLFVSIL
jgi:hypothetical protein